MQTYSLGSFEQWREVARRLLLSRQTPADVDLIDKYDSQRTLFDGVLPDIDPPAVVSDRSGPTPNFARVPRRFLELARRVSCHRDGDRFNLLYRLLWRLTHGQPELLEIATDPDVFAAERMEKQVRRDAHKAKAFVRFRRCEDEDGGERFVAWHRPDHRVLSLIGPFFARRFPEMHWTILTPSESACWNTRQLVFGPGATSDEAPSGDELEAMWKTYYGAIFNPARIKLDTMVREMPRRHWPTLPETEIIEDLLAEAPRRLDRMARLAQDVARTSVQDLLPSDSTPESLRRAAAGCQACDLHRNCTQTVFGEGPESANWMLIGEQPGDREDLAGRPFVGPAGDVLNQALEQAGVDRNQLYLTNAVKHFHHQPRGKRRLHKRPEATHVEACRPWLYAEIALVRPKLIVCLGATAAQAILGRAFRLRDHRGLMQRDRENRSVLATHHPAAMLRARDDAHRQQILQELVSDLRHGHGRIS